MKPGGNYVWVVMGSVEIGTFPRHARSASHMTWAACASSHVPLAAARATVTPALPHIRLAAACALSCSHTRIRINMHVQVLEYTVIKDQVLCAGGFTELL